MDREYLSIMLTSLIFRKFRVWRNDRDALFGLRCGRVADVRKRHSQQRLSSLERIKRKLG